MLEHWLLDLVEEHLVDNVPKCYEQGQSSWLAPGRLACNDCVIYHRHSWFHNKVVRYPMLGYRFRNMGPRIYELRESNS